MRFKNKLFIKLFVLLAVTFTFCEFLNYYLVISWCSWPEFKHEEDGNESNYTIKAMFLADTHLLGPLKGHWFDKLRREWQMHRAFQSAISLYNPEAVFFLGDLFDEGLWANEERLKIYHKRFFSLFEVPTTTKIYVVPGNHDLGFHYEIYPYRMYQFEKIFNITSVQLLSIKGSHFILINSMAMEGDECYLCSGAEKKIHVIASKLRCAKNKKNCKGKLKLENYSRPIILQHFPMYRKSDIMCKERDEAPSDLKKFEFREKWECLSKKASELLYDTLDPRLILSGHVHHGCHLVHRKDIHEYTLSSFSWRNKNNPTFMLAKITPSDFVVKKCDIPRETTVIFIYACTFLVVLVSIVYSAYNAKVKSKCL